MKQTYSEGLFMWYRICITDVMMKIIEPMINPTEKSVFWILIDIICAFLTVTVFQQNVLISYSVSKYASRRTFLFYIAFFCEYPKIQFGLVGLLHTYNEPEPSLG